MGEISWSPEQLRIIESRNKNLLVSAAAGAGKTTVMVERIIGLITQETRDIDIDKLLIVTFTRDAASNMREKLSGRLADMLDADPGNRNLVRQQMILQNARITTIDSFCNSVVKEFFYRIDIDPSFRIADKAEMALLRHKVLDELLEEKYAAAEPDFLLLVESYCGTRNDEKLNRLIEDLANASYAQAWPQEWLNEQEKDLIVDIGSTKLRPAWKEAVFDICKRGITGAAAVSDGALALGRTVAAGISTAGDTKAEEKKQKFIDILANENNALHSLLTADNRDRFENILKTLDFERLMMPKGITEEDQSDIKKAREKYKSIIKKLVARWFSETEEDLAFACSEAAKPLCVLVRLTKEYIGKLIAAKMEKNIYEFSDISHFALDILAHRNDDGSVEPTEAAMELRDRFHDIFIDEYQDSDAVQEQIAEVIAGPAGQKPFTFMVGDVKQSIYKFRMARPELFIGRSHRYEADPGQGELIHLGLNYRSSRAVVNSTNDVFRLCMHEETGKVEYDEAAELVCGKESAEVPEEDITEIILADVKVAGSENKPTEAAEGKAAGDTTGADDRNSESATGGNTADTGRNDEAGNDTAEEYSSARICAEAAARRIRELIADSYPIRNKDNTTRTVGYKDIVILLRSKSGSAQVYKEVLENAGIPAFSDSGQGFLNAYEISVVINYLRLLDNPFQDIPLASVLRSVMGGLDDDELARLRIFGGFDTRYWQCLEKYAENGPKGILKDKCIRFLNIYSEIRRMNMTRDIDKVIFAIYEKTGFYLYCSALPGGDSRTSNLELLLSYAAQYEKGSSSGLFDFVGYIEEITRADDDLEEAVSTEASNAVRIMTIHKSKGLEFPVVILGDAAKQFNLKDKDSEVVISPDYGIASKCIMPDKRIKCNTLRRMLMSNMIEQDTIGEELRLLYVAMTRAMQKLIVIGRPGKKGKKKEDWIMAASESNTRFPDHYTASAGGYMDLLYPAALMNPDDFRIKDVYIQAEDSDDGLPAPGSDRAAFRQPENLISEEDIKICGELSYIYEQDEASSLPVKLSVSDIKHAGMEEEGVSTPWRNPDKKHTLFEHSGNQGASDSNSSEAAPITGAELGSLYHKIMQFIPFDISGVTQVASFLNGMAGLEENETCAGNHCYAIISPAERAALDDAVIAGFLDTELCKRMKEADAAGRLYREQPFMLGKKACEIYPEKYPGCEELIPVQGIIDCMFEEEDGFVILDYKTDSVDRENGPRELKERYHKQLELYGEAASRILGRTVKEMVLYSFTLGECVNLGDGVSGSK